MLFSMKFLSQSFVAIFESANLNEVLGPEIATTKVFYNNTWQRAKLNYEVDLLVFTSGFVNFTEELANKWDSYFTIRAFRANNVVLLQTGCYTLTSHKINIVE